jgi:tetratricopeptide (TPR) repeat protein
VIDSSFARVYTGLALMYWSRYYSDTFFKDDFMDSCLVLSEKALSLDKNLDEAYLLRGRYYREYGQFEKALDDFNRAIAINPNCSPAYIHKGALLAWTMNDYVSGIENLHRALNLVYGNDRPQVQYLLGNFYMNTGFLDKAEYFSREALKLTGDSARYLGDLVWIEFSREDFDEALKFDRMAYEFDSTYLSDFIICCIPPVTIREAFRDAERILAEIEKSGRFRLQNSYRVGYAFLQAGKQKEAEHYINQQIKLSKEGIKLNRYISQQKVAQYDLAAVYAFKGDREKAYQYLEEYSEKSYFRPPEISLTKHDPFFAGIRNEERFKKIVQKMETKYKAEHERVRKWLEEQGML